MKKNKFTLGWFFISLMMAFSMTACDDDDDTDAIDITFPEKQLIGGAVDSTHPLTFNAAANWQLTTSSTWCAFKTENGQVEYALSGKAGEQTVQIYISDEAQDYDASVALITLTMNGQETVIAEVTRNAVNRQLTVYKKDADGKWIPLAENEALVVPRFNNRLQEKDAYQEYMVSANFRFAASDRPDWLVIRGGSVVGSVNQEVVFGIKCLDKPSVYKYPHTNGQLNFQDEDGKSIFTYTVNYEGMDPESMTWEGPDQWNWEVDLEGKTFTQTVSGVAGTDNINNSYNGFVEYNVTAFDDNFIAVYVEKIEEAGYTRFITSIPDPEYPEETVDWLHLKKYDNGKVRIMVDPATEPREGYVLVFPEALYHKIEKDPYDQENGLFEMNMETFMQDLKYRYTENNLLMNVIQKKRQQNGGDGQNEVTIKNQLTGEDVTFSELTGEEADFYLSEWGAKKAYTLSAKDANSIRVNVPYEVGTYYAEMQGIEVTDEYCGMPEDGVTTALDIWGFTGIQKEMVVAIRDAMWQEVIVIIIRP
ncbi:hypothetical protein, secreted [gut metagenome]|uniref:DUF5003 domain-containing protein n=1 Tax=gut metagenome TaxID=749906 RepID=J9GRW3_9ZZZZ